jgi:hypothetical protein
MTPLKHHRVRDEMFQATAPISVRQGLCAVTVGLS